MEYILHVEVTQIIAKRHPANVGITMPARQSVTHALVENVNVGQLLRVRKGKFVITEVALILAMILFVRQVAIIA